MPLFRSKSPTLRLPSRVTRLPLENQPRWMASLRLCRRTRRRLRPCRRTRRRLRRCPSQLRRRYLKRLRVAERRVCRPSAIQRFQVNLFFFLQLIFHLFSFFIKTIFNFVFCFSFVMHDTGSFCKIVRVYFMLFILNILINIIFTEGLSPPHRSPAQIPLPGTPPGPSGSPGTSPPPGTTPVKEQVRAPSSAKGDNLR